jgi:hypothetical protein
MPSKSHRAASRQAKLRQKRRRSSAAAQVFQAGPTESKVATEESSAAPALRPAPAAKASPQPARRSKRAAAAQTAPRYMYLSTELRRIGVVSMVILVILAAVSFVLSS